MSNSRFRTDPDVFAIAQRILPEAGYVTEVDAYGNESILLAENAYSIIGLAATATINDLYMAEPLVEALLQTRIDRVEIGTKLWDAYIVLLTREIAGETAMSLGHLFSINYDTRGYRRLARIGVEPTIRGVRNALTPFVAPVELEDVSLLEDPLTAMSEALISHGVDESLTRRAIEIFQQGGDLGDVI